MNSGIEMTPELAREWLADNAKVPDCWQPIFNAQSKVGDRRRYLIAAFADGFYLESDGETVTAPMTPKRFVRYAHAISGITVCTPNPDVINLKTLIASTEQKTGLGMDEKAARSTFLQAARKYLAALPEHEQTFLKYEQYLSFVRQGVLHSVPSTHVHRAFFSRFPQAKLI